MQSRDPASTRAITGPPASAGPSIKGDRRDADIHRDAPRRGRCGLRDDRGDGGERRGAARLLEVVDLGQPARLHRRRRETGRARRRGDRRQVQDPDLLRRAAGQVEREPRRHQEQRVRGRDVLQLLSPGQEPCLRGVLAALRASRRLGGLGLCPQQAVRAPGAEGGHGQVERHDLRLDAAAAVRVPGHRQAAREARGLEGPAGARRRRHRRRHGDPGRPRSRPSRPPRSTR